MVELVHLAETRRVSARLLLNASTLFENDTSLLNGPYRVRSPVSAEVFRCFVSAV
jgi:hypothetical protein